ncbi:hypothetical protein K0A96_00530 [Patescibacteria group bacterium]|nr:hypothetical protein [Patescibacteria group bacterium]
MITKKTDIDWDNFGDTLKQPRVIGLIVGVVSLLSLGALVYMVYAEDKPAFIPEEIREDVRGAIVEKIGQPLQSISNPAGTFIINAAHDKAKAYAYGHDKTKNWPTYTDEDLGISLQYPEGWMLVNNDGLVKIHDLQYENYESEFPMIIFEKYQNEFIDLESWLNKNKDIFIGEQNPEDVVGFLERKSSRIVGRESLEFVYENMGSNNVTLIKYDEWVLVFEAVGNTKPGEGDINYYEEIIRSVR